MSYSSNLEPSSPTLPNHVHDEPSSQAAQAISPVALQNLQNSLNEQEDSHEAGILALPIHFVEPNSIGDNTMLKRFPETEQASASNDDGDEICTVCQEELQDSSDSGPLRRLSCSGGHTFHLLCITRWLQHVPEKTARNPHPLPFCPQCRTGFRIVWRDPSGRPLKVAPPQSPADAVEFFDDFAAAMQARGANATPEERANFAVIQERRLRARAEWDQAWQARVEREAQAHQQAMLQRVQAEEQAI